MINRFKIKYIGDKAFYKMLLRYCISNYGPEHGYEFRKPFGQHHGRYSWN